MLFSIIVPVYNSSKYLNRCLDSIVNQKFDDYEILLIDDGSTDESPNICDEYSKKYSFIRVIHKENGGTVSARRTGVKEAKGDYILSIDSDDYVDEDYFDVIHHEIVKNNFPSIVAWSYKSVDEVSGEIKKITNQDTALGNYTKEDIKSLKEVLLYNKNLPNLNYGSLLYSFWTKAIKRELLLDAFMSFKNDINYGEDLICVKRILDNPNCNNVTLIDYYGYNYVDNSGSLINASYSIRKAKSYEQTVIELKNDFSDEENKISIYAIRALLGLIYSIAITSNKYKEFLNKVKETYCCSNLWEYAKKAKINKGKKDKLKIFLIKSKWFRVLYKVYKR